MNFCLPVQCMQHFAVQVEDGRCDENTSQQVQTHTQSCLPCSSRCMKCGLHQLGRVTAIMLEAAGLSAVLYSFTRVLRLRRKQRSFKNSFLQAVYSNTTWLPFERPADTVATSLEWTRDLLRLLVPRNLGQKADATSPHYVDIQNYVNHFNGNRALEDGVHYCDGCCKTEKECKRKGKVLAKKAAFANAGHLFETTRYLKQWPTIQEWMLKLLVGNFACRAITSCDFKEEGAAILQAAVGEMGERERVMAEI